ncbi:MAG TPA: GatB/YqeY domain-containing protein [Gemmataceae bacterium]|nr:GatB/YqeY domain-containing protein [Gemmataceae bacterium]
MDLHGKLTEAMKAKDDLAKDMLRVILGEVSTRKARTGKEPRDEEVHAIIRSVMTNNAETRKELEQRGQTAHESYERLGRENAYLAALLPKTLDQDAIRKELEAIAAELKAAKNDGQATGLAVKHVKQKGLTVLGEDVAAVVKQMRAD